MAAIDVVVPCRVGDVPTETIQTIMAGTVTDVRFIVVVDSKQQGQSWARNRGAEMVTAPLLLFSDYDILWDRQALEQLMIQLGKAVLAEETTIGQRYRTGFSFCRFQWTEGKAVRLELAQEEWDADTLKRRPFISPMSLWSTPVWRETGLRFDESLRRLEDWDLYLTAAERGIRGEWMSQVGFTTVVKPGISWEDQSTFQAAEFVIRAKHGLR